MDKVAAFCLRALTRVYPSKLVDEVIVRCGRKEECVHLWEQFFWSTAADSLMVNAPTLGAVIAHGFAEEHRRPWLALVDGNNEQVRHIRKHAKRSDVDTVVLVDFVHVLEYLWRAAWCFFDEKDPAAEKWVHAKALEVLRGNSAQVGAAVRRKATAAALEPHRRKAADRCADYLKRKRAHLDYPTALASGWPIGTGVIEGTCPPLVQDRLGIAGARWGLDSAEAVLKLRALRTNGDFDRYWRFHLAQEQQRVHASRYLGGVIPASS